MSAFQDTPIVAYYQVDDFSVFDDEDEFFELCDELNFEPFAPQESESSEIESLTDEKPIVSKKRTQRIEDADDSPYRPVEGERKKKKGPAPVAVEKQSNTGPVTVEQISEDGDQNVAKNLEFKFMPKDDIRRKFGTTFFDALNQVEGPDSLDDFMNTHMLSDLFSFFKYVGTVPQDYFNPYIELVGRESCLKFWKAILEAYPDSVFELHDTSIKVLMNGFTSITTKYSYTGTKVLDLVTDGRASAVIITDNSKSDGEGGHYTYAFELEEGTNRVLDRPPVENKMVVGISSRGERVCTVGTMTFHVNPDKKIYKAEFLHCMKSRSVFN